MSDLFNILVIDDDPTMRDCCLQVLSRQGCTVQVAENGQQGLAQLQMQQFDVVLLDLKMPGLGGLDVLERIRLIDPDVSVIMITGFATVQSAVRSMKGGAFDFIPKPFTPALLRTVVSRALEQRRSRPVDADPPAEAVRRAGEAGPGDTAPPAEAVRRAGGGVERLIGETTLMKRLRMMIRRIGASGSTVLITGESGTGKELVARALHRHSPRSAAPFVVVDCGCLVDSLAEAELFGHVKGAFTGADCTRQGRFQQADGGSIFLDEISNVNIFTQHKLLRVLQEFEVGPIGSDEMVRVDVRVIAASNADLAERVKNGCFREDLYHRVNVIPIHLPALRDRRGDIPLLAEHFFRVFNASRREGRLKGISDAAFRVLEEYDWPGNVRELENLIERSAVLTDHETIGEADWAWDHKGSMPGHAEGIPQTTLLCDAEREHIRHVLARYNQNILRSARALGIDRKTLRQKARKYGLLGGVEPPPPPQ
ncbi:MAG TPA: sigma-54 dependent transcriptional regulator [Planctomycetota bacterium]|nr:sigma-54 dependent transcriptional regulator [Planctomycetota bacterium]